MRQAAGSAMPEGDAELAVLDDMAEDGLEPAGPDEADPEEAGPVGLAVASAEVFVLPLSVEAQPVDATATSANPASNLLPDDKFTRRVCNRSGPKTASYGACWVRDGVPDENGREGAT